MFARPTTQSSMWAGKVWAISAQMRLVATLIATALCIFCYIGMLWRNLGVLSLKIPASEILPESMSCVGHNKCLFVVSTGRSGSTTLQHALNQLPGIFIRGENFGLFELHERFASHLNTINWHQRLNLTASAKLEAKQEYNIMAQSTIKPAHFNGFPLGIERCISKWVFKTLYGSGPYSDHLVGFKEIRYSPVLSNITDYTKFERHLAYLNSLCESAKFIFNFRRNTTRAAQSGFFKKVPWNTEDWVSILSNTTAWFNTYKAKHQNTMNVVYEDMFDPSVNATLAKTLLKFIGKKEAEYFTFDVRANWTVLR